MTGAALFFVPTDFINSEISLFDARSVGDPPQSVQPFRCNVILNAA